MKFNFDMEIKKIKEKESLILEVFKFLMHFWCHHHIVMKDDSFLSSLYVNDF